jgi:Tol biopolymer transport system component
MPMRIRSYLVWLAAVAAAVTMTASSPGAVLAKASAMADPTYPGSSSLSAALTGKIVFSSTRDGNQQIYIMDADGANQTRLTNNSATDANPKISSDGRKIVFDSNRDGNLEIYVMNADGTNQTRLTSNTFSDIQPAWSPDGSKIPFSSNRTGTRQIWAMTAEGSSPTQLTVDPHPDIPSQSVRCNDPEWSKDGTRITFSSVVFTDLEAIWVMNADGSNGVEILDEAMSPWIGQPTWSPDNTRIACSWSNGQGQLLAQIMTMDPDGTDRVVLTGVNQDLAPSYSPDGSMIAFSSSRDGNNEIYVMDADGSDQTRLTSNAVDDSHPSWGPAATPPSTGNTIGTVASTPFYTGAANQYNLYIKITSTTVSGLTVGQQVYCAASVTDFPNLLTIGATLTGTLDHSLGWWVFKKAMVQAPPATGNAIGTVVYSDGGICIINPDGTGFTRLTDDNATQSFDESPAWSPDGSRIVFCRSSRKYYPDIWLMNADGSNQVQLATEGSDPAFSPDGTRIVFVGGASYIGSMDHIHAMNADGTGRKSLTVGSGPAWSADSNRIFYSVFTPGLYGNNDIYVMNADGSGQIRLTDTSSCQGPACRPAAMLPAVSPDGKKVAYVRCDYSGMHPADIHVMNADGSNDILIGTFPLAWAPAWSPDGTKIIFTQTISSFSYISIMNADGSNATTLVRGSNPDWRGPDSATGFNTIGTVASTTCT